MDKEELAQKLGGVMDTVTVCEGLIYSKLDGEVIIGQTLTEMNHDSISRNISKIFKLELSAAEKGAVRDVSIELDEGALVAVKNESHFVIGLLGSDGLSSKGLLRRQLQNIMND